MITAKRGLIAALAGWIAVVFLCPSFPQQPVSMLGTWELSLINTDSSWNGTRHNWALKVTCFVYQFDVAPESYATMPNLRLDLQGEDPMPGFIRGDETFVFFRNNNAHCGGPDHNLGREIISGTLLANGHRFAATGIGFDSNPQCGGTWTYNLTATKISNPVP